MDSNHRPPACEDTMGCPDAAFRSFPALSAGCGRRISSHPLRWLRANFSACGSQCGSSPRNRGKFLGSGGLLYCNGSSEKDSYQGRSSQSKSAPQNKEERGVIFLCYIDLSFFRPIRRLLKRSQTPLSCNTSSCDIPK